MARIRSIKPEFFTSIPVAGLSRDARLLFIGLWTHVDDEGRCDDDPRLIKAAVFPLDDDLTARKVAGLVDELETKGRIIRYSIGTRSYLAVCGWEHQKIDRPRASKIPPPTDEQHEASTNDRRSFDDASSSPRPLIIGSLDQGSLECVLDESTTTRRPPDPSGFDEFWKRYPRKASKGDAKKAYAKAIKSGVTLDQLLKALEAQRLEQGDPKFIPYPASWLNGERWNDDPRHAAAGTPIRSGAGMDDIIVGPDGVAMSRWTLARQ